MAEELELSEYSTIHDLGGKKVKTGTSSINSAQSERRLLRMGIVTLGVLCILQAILNISLHLAVYSKEDINQFPCNTSVIEDMCQTEQFQSNSTHLCSCCNNLLQSLLRERDLLQDKISRFSRGFEDMQISGSGSFF